MKAPAPLIWLLAIAATAAAGPVRAWTHLVDAHTTLMGGAYDPIADGTPGGVFLGFGYGASPSERVDFDFVGDYFYRSRSRSSAPEPAPGFEYDVPVEAESSTFLASTHLAEIGVIGRLRFPTTEGGPVPFVEGGPVLQLLHLRASGESDGPEPRGRGHFRGSETRSDTFTGIGWRAGGGIEQPLDARFALRAELGYSYAEPTKTFANDGDRVTYVAKASGMYGRAGLRLTY